MTKKQWLKIFIFLGLFVYLLVTVTYVLRMSGKTKDRFAGFYAEKKNSLDVVMIGSSPVYPCYAAPYIYGTTGIAAYPLSSSMQLPSAGYYLVKEAQKTQNPSLYVFELRMYSGRANDIVANPSHIREVTDYMQYSLNRVDTINTLVDDKDSRYTYYFDIFKYHSNWPNLLRKEQWRSWSGAAPEPLKGFDMASRVGPGEEPDVAEVTETFPVEALQEKSLRKLLAYLQKENLNALFIVTPYNLDAEKEMQFNYLEEIIDSYGYYTLNMNRILEEIGLDFDRDFQDGGGHTNAVGSQKVSRYFAEYLKEHYDLTDHRGDQAYASWDEAYALYESQYGEAVADIERRIEEKDFSTSVNDD